MALFRVAKAGAGASEYAVVNASQISGYGYAGYCDGTTARNSSTSGDFGNITGTLVNIAGWTMTFNVDCNVTRVDMSGNMTKTTKSANETITLNTDFGLYYITRA